MNTLQKLTNQCASKSDSSNIKRVKQFDLLQQHKGFNVYQAVENRRLHKVLLTPELTREFLHKVEMLSVTDLEYVASNRFFLAYTLNSLTDNKLGQLVNDLLQDRNRGAFLFGVEGAPFHGSSDFESMLKLSTAVSFLFGKANLDSMSSLYYARFSVQLKDNSDSYLRKFSQRMTLHNDGTFVDEITDYVLMMKVEEKDVEGGNSLLLHLDDWEHLVDFYQHPLSGHSFKFSAPASKHVDHCVYHPVFHRDRNGLPCLAYIDQFVKPALPEEGLYLHALNQSLENSQGVLGFEVPVGMMLVCNNHCWLHGRDKFMAIPTLFRELMRQRGVFFDNLRHNAAN